MRNHNNLSFVGFRLPAEVHEEILHRCDSAGCTISEWLRVACVAALQGDATQLGLGGIAEGFKQSQQYAVHLAHAAIQQAMHELPSSFEEAVARYGPPTIGPKRFNGS